MGDDRKKAHQQRTDMMANATPMTRFARFLNPNVSLVRWLCWPLGLALLLGAARSDPAAPSIGASEFDCVIEPQQTVKLASPVVGVIAQLDVDRGDIVHRGQVVGKLEDGVEVATLALARAKASNDYTLAALETRLLFQRRKFDRLSKLSTNMFSSVTALEDAESDYKVTEQQISEAKLNRELARLEVVHAEEVVNQRTLRSPVDGVVVERLLVPGEYRNEQSPVLTLAQIDPLRTEVFVPTAYYGQVRDGGKATIRPEPPIGGSYLATVTVVDRVLDAASGTFGVRLALPNPELALPAGIRCKVRFDTRASDRTPAVAEGEPLAK
jgi:RND family efflux transporter MFP subunit